MQCNSFEMEEIVEIKNCIMLYDCARLTVLNKLNILNAGFQAFQEYNPIGHIESRLKSLESVMAKLCRLGFDLTEQSVRCNLYDVAGVRIVCNFETDIKTLVELVMGMPDLEVFRVKDYVSNPKPSGYRGYHLIIDVPVIFHSKVEILPVELQIRTEAMDFWASLEHKLKYKYGGKVPEAMKQALVHCAESTAEIDSQMLSIHEQIKKYNCGGINA